MNTNSTIFSVPTSDGAIISMVFTKETEKDVRAKIITRVPDHESTYYYSKYFFKDLLKEGSKHGGYIWQASKK